MIADFDDREIIQSLQNVGVPFVGVGGSYHDPDDYPPVHYIATDNHALVQCAFMHLKEKGLNRFAFYGLPPSGGKGWAQEHEYAFRQLVASEQYQGVVYQGMETAPDNWQYAQNRLADWVQALPPQTGIITVTDARARHLLQVFEYLNIAVPEKLCVIGIDNEELTPLSISGGALICCAGHTADGLSRRQIAASVVTPSGSTTSSAHFGSSRAGGRA